jgi:TonB family protein
MVSVANLRTMLRQFTINLMRIVFLCCVLGVLPAKLLAQSATGITASGKTVTAAPEQKPPWMGDVIKTVPLEYPYNDRRNYHQGKGLFRVVLDLKTGLVRDVRVIKSIGYPTLDDAAVSALRQWRLKPGKWKQFDFHVTYEMARSRDDAMEKLRRLQAKEPP